MTHNERYVAILFCTIFLQIATPLDNELSERSVLKLASVLKQDPPQVKPAEFDHLYKDTVNSTKEVIFEYKYLEIENKTTAVRITVKILSDLRENFPVLFVVRQQQGILSWQIPLFLEYTYYYKKVSRTLCPVDAAHRRNMTTNQTIYLDVSTMEKDNVNFSVQATSLSSFQLRTNEERNISVTPSEPQYYMYTFPDNVDSIIVLATSESDLCLTFSIQDIKCPVFDLDRDVEFSGVHQTMTKQSAITVEKSNYEQHSFYVVMVLKPNDLDCNGVEVISKPGYERSKNLKVKIIQTISATKYYVAIVASVSVFVAFYVAALIIGIIYHGCQKNWGVWELENEDTAESSSLAGPSQGLSYGTYSPINENVHPAVYKELGRVPAGNTASPMHSDTISQDSLDLSDVDFLSDASSEKDVLRTKTALFVCDLARKTEKRQEKNYKVYCRNLGAIAIFYGLPVMQLVMTYQQVLHVTGDQDICYYNFDCARPLGVLSAFNNVFSNIGYVMLGALFLILVWRRDIVYRKAVGRNPDVARKYGIPQHNGLFYSMGLALCMEGVMSACYHVCPNYSNFQFDTSFMYIIACLCMLRIYQSRHPDISAKAHTSYLVMAFVIFIAVLGVVKNTKAFWVVFCVLDMVGILVISVYLYYMGTLKMNCGIFKRMYRSVRYERGLCMRPTYKDRFVLLSIGVLLNWSCAIFGGVTQPENFASYLLGIFIGNLLLYCSFYIIMKLRYKENINLLTVVCIVAATIVWGFALYFFFSHLTSWQLTPSRSREGNQPCLLLDFFDKHDVWHFLSAISMFFSFLILLTLDDDLFTTRRDRIPVF